jgi:ferredoxin-NADP reductase
MREAETTPVVAWIGRYPVKGLGGERLDSAEISPRGIAWDRAFALSNLRLPIERFGKWTSYEAFHALDGRPDLGGHRARVLDRAPDGPTLEINHRDGGSIQLLLDETGRFASDTPDERIDSWFGTSKTTAEIVASGTNLWDVEYASISIINLATVREISRAAGTELDPRRFRANIYIDGLEPWKEFELAGRTLRVGDVVLDVAEPIVRCRATSVHPDRGGTDVNVPGVLGSHFGHGFCGVYARVRSAGKVSAGDGISISWESIPHIDASLLEGATVEAPRPARIVSAQRAGTHATSLEFEDSFGLLAGARPGQHLRVHRTRAGDAAWRSYTISRAEAGLVRITVGDRDEGWISNWIAGSAVGDSVTVSGPYGDAVVDPGEGPVVVLTAGIGVTPALAVAHALPASAHDRKVDFVHVERAHTRVAHLDELELAVESNPSANFHLYITGSDRRPEDMAGRPDRTAIAALLTDPAATTVLMCGPQTFVDAMREIVIGLGIPATAIRSDPFYSPRAGMPTVKKPPREGPFRVLFEGARPVEVLWEPQSGTLLDAGQAAGLPLPSSCRAGLCGSCAQRIDGDTFDVIDPLIPVPAGRTLLCCAVPVGPVTVRSEV